MLTTVMAIASRITIQNENDYYCGDDFIILNGNNVWQDFPLKPTNIFDAIVFNGMVHVTKCTTHKISMTFWRSYALHKSRVIFIFFYFWLVCICSFYSVIFGGKNVHVFVWLYFLIACNWLAHVSDLYYIVIFLCVAFIVFVIVVVAPSTKTNESANCTNRTWTNNVSQNDFAILNTNATHSNTYTHKTHKIHAYRCSLIVPTMLESYRTTQSWMAYVCGMMMSFICFVML